MKRLMILCIAVFSLVGAARAQWQIDTIYYDKDWKGVDHPAFATYYRITMVPEDPNYPKRCRDFWMDGTLQSEGQFISIDKYDDSKSIFDGESLISYKSGALKEKCTRSENGTIVKSEVFREDGKPAYSGSTKNGKLEGVYIQYHENGKMAFHGEYVEGKQNVVTITWAENGNLISKVTYKDDVYNGPAELYDENGKLSVKMNLVDGKQNGEKYYYNENRVVMETYKDDVLDGAYKQWDNGKLSITANYKAGKIDGVLQFYNKDEQPASSKVYDNGLLLKHTYANGNTYEYKELLPAGGENAIRVSGILYPIRAYSKYVKFNNLELNLFNPTTEDVMVNIENIQVHYVSEKKGDKFEFPYNQLVKSADVKWLYDGIAKNAIDGSDKIAKRIAKQGSTSTTRSSSQSSSNSYSTVYEGSMWDKGGWDPAARGYGNSSTSHSSTTTHQDKALEYQILQNESKKANSTKEIWEQRVNQKVISTNYQKIRIAPNSTVTKEILSYKDLYHSLSGKVKGDITEILISFTIDGKNYQVKYATEVPTLTSSQIKKNEKEIEEQGNVVQNRAQSKWEDLDYYIDWGAWYNYKKLIEAHSKNIVEEIKQSK